MHLWNHDFITYSSKRVKVVNPDGSTRAAFRVTYDGNTVGYVARAARTSDGWAYLLRDDESRPWTTGFRDRADAADHLLSAWSPSAAWLSR